MKRKIYINICFVSLITMIVTTILILSISYNQYNNQIKKDVQNDTNLIVHQLNNEENKIEFLKGASNISKRISLISVDGNVIFDNSTDILNLKNYNDLPEILSAKSSGFGEAIRVSDNFKKNTYYYAVLLNNGMVLRATSTVNNILSLFLNILPIIFLMTFFILIFAFFIATKLTKKIINPINKINLESISDAEIYDELLPFIKKISQQKKKANFQIEQLKNQKVRLNIISENMNEGLIVTDIGGMILSINSSALKIFGLAKDDVINKIFLHLTRELEIIDYFNSALKGNNGRKTININNITYELFYSPVFENNTVCGSIMLFFDINERIKSEKIRREFSANVSHELKTPITTILGYSQMINNGMARVEDVKIFANKIEKEAVRLIALIDDIIKLSRLDEQDSAKEMQNVNLFDIVSDIANSLENQLKEKGIKLTIKGNDTIIAAISSMLEELVFNLLDNAIKYNKTGGSIDIFVGNTKLSISDTGIGIPSECQERIFERFYRVDASRSKKISGTGLGLSIVKHIALLHQAEIDVISDLGKGTTITVNFKDKPDLRR